MSPFTTILAWVLGIVAALTGGFLIGFRTRFRPFLDAVRHFNRRVNNPRQLRSAGQAGAWAAVVHHVGRTSGRHYRTPAVPVRTADGGLLFSLPYGASADWVRNIMAAGSAMVTSDGRDLHVANPRIVGLDVARQDLPPGEVRTARVFGVRDFLLVDLA